MGPYFVRFFCSDVESIYPQYHLSLYFSNFLLNQTLFEYLYGIQYSLNSMASSTHLKSESPKGKQRTHESASSTYFESNYEITLLPAPQLYVYHIHIHTHICIHVYGYACVVFSTSMTLSYRFSYAMQHRFLTYTPSTNWISLEECLGQIKLKDFGA